jgi:hypothetical protein
VFSLSIELPLLGMLELAFVFERDEEVDDEDDKDDLAAKSAFIIDNFDCMLSLVVGVPEEDDE